MAGKLGGDLVFLSAAEMAEAIRTKAVSAVEVLESHLQQIERHNPALRAIATLDRESAWRRAVEADAALARGDIWGPLHGVPVTVKDSFETAGLLTTAGHRPLARHIPKQDATVVARLKSAGAIVLGKTNMPALGGAYQTDNRLFGRTNNPWDLSRTPGGSTGGGAAAVAAGFSSLEIGSDIGGSIRIPAHFCGVLGLKPTEHSVSGAGHIPPLPGSAGNVRHLIGFGPLARSVADLQLALSVIAGPDDRDTMVQAGLAAGRQRPLRELRLAWTDDFGGIPVTPDTSSALEGLAADLRTTGCRVERCSPSSFDFKASWKTCYEISTAERHAVGPLLEKLIMIFGTSLMPRKSPMMKGFARGLRTGVRSYFKALEQRDRLIASLERFLQDWDAWICPVSSVPAFEHQRTLSHARGLKVGRRRVPYEMAIAAHTLPFNLTGNPVVVLPLARSAEGLPIGFQMVGPRWHDMELLNMAQQLTEITGPFQRPPGY